jgi:ABC-type nickel/cobalt efflux system permease component RcnA
VRQQGPGSPAFLLLLLFAFLYGLLHALGPGHRKTVLFSYFLARGVPLRTGVAAGLSMALLHGASAIAIVLFIYYILRGALLIGLQQTETIMEQATFGLIALFGAFMLIKALLHLFHSGNAHEAGSEESSAEAAAAADAAAGSAAAASGGRDTSTSAASSGRRDTGTAVLVLFSGLLPCPGAAMILLFALSLDMLGLGLLTVIAMSLGMGVTLAAVALVTLGGRRLLLPKPGGDGKRIAVLHHAVEAAGYMLVTLIGVFMYLAVV